MKTATRRRIVYLLAAVMFLFVFLPVRAEAAAYIKSGGLIYTVTSTAKKTASVSASSTAIKKAAIQDTVTIAGKSYKVTSVEAGGFKGCKKLTSVTLGKNILKIGKSAFQSCKKIKSFTITGKVRTIGAKAFMNCTKLQTIYMKSGKLKSIGTKAFLNINPRAVFVFNGKYTDKMILLTRTAGIESTMTVR